jgi:hypothetical protein
MRGSSDPLAVRGDHRPSDRVWAGVEFPSVRRRAWLLGADAGDGSAGTKMFDHHDATPLPE